ncbi:MAG TPA: hypothetical protein VFE84_04060, partial [Patescibacteria group bacterium]|nr:hypothetical protein [Patescibacteria group bacterium]
VEVHAAEEKADMFRDLFGLELVFCRARTGHSARSIHFSGEAPAARRSRRSRGSRSSGGSRRSRVSRLSRR